MIVFACLIFPNLKNHGIQSRPYPANGPILVGEICTAVEVIGMRKNLLHFFKVDSTVRICLQPLALPSIEAKSHPVV